MNKTYMIISLIILLIPFMMWFMRNLSKISSSRGISEKRFQFKTKTLIIVSIVCVVIALTLAIVGVVTVI